METVTVDRNQVAELELHTIVGVKAWERGAKKTFVLFMYSFMHLVEIVF